MLAISDYLRFLPALALALVACQPKIGDECVTDVDCSQSGDRICDTTQVDGYCTQVDCDPVSCPEKESICIAFNNTPSTVGACNTQGRTSPYRRTFCMDTCKGADDCRSGYVCQDMDEENIWGASVIQDDPQRTTVCVQAQTFAPIDEDRSDQVCTGSAQATSDNVGGAGGASEN